MKLLSVKKCFLVSCGCWLLSSLETRAVAAADFLEEHDDDDDSTDHRPANKPSSSSSSSLAQQLAAAAAWSASDSSSSSGGLVWTDLAVMTTTTPTSTVDESDESGINLIVRPCSGILRNGQVCGFLGPSGAGKSSFSSAIAGTQTLPWKGSVYHYQQQPPPPPQQQEYLNNSNSSANTRFHKQHHPTSSSPQQQELVFRLEHIVPNQVAWLQQHDAFFEMLTVRETLQLAARLELPHLTRRQRDALIDTKLHALGLQPVAHRRVGSYVSGGSSRLSGGERRRLAVALELLTEKHLFLADEPTTGLDSTMSARVMKLIHDTAQQLDIPALVVLHQPRSSVWHSLDSVIFMAAGGRVCYHGPRAEAVDYFAQLGHACPPATNPAEYFVDLISIDPEDPVKAAHDEERVAELAQAFRAYQQEQWVASSRRQPPVRLVAPPGYHLNDDAEQYSHDHHAAKSFMAVRQQRPPLFSWIPRFGALLLRSWRQNIRNVVTNSARLAMSTSMGLLMTQIFPTVRGPVPTANSMADRAAMLTVAAVIVCNMAFMKSADLFEKENPIVRREQMRHQYSSLEYLMAKVLAEVPLDAFFSAVFSTVLKQFSGIRISWNKLAATYSLLTAAGASLGYLLGSVFAQNGLAVNAGLPILVILMVVGVINPGGVDPNRPPPPAVQFLQRFSPFTFAIRAIMIGEFKDMQFQTSSGWFSRVRELPRMGAMAMVQNGNQVLDALGLADETYAGAMKCLAYLTAGNLACSWIGLLLQQKRPVKSRPSGASKDKVTRGSTRSQTTKPTTIRRVRL